MNKVQGGLQELEETLYWLELISDAKLANQKSLQVLMTESDELIAIFVSMVKKVKARRKQV